MKEAASFSETTEDFNDEGLSGRKKLVESCRIGLGWGSLSCSWEGKESRLDLGEVRRKEGFTSSKSMRWTWTVSVPEVGLVGDWISLKVSNPDVFAMITPFESFDRSDTCFSTPGGGDVE